MKETRQARKGTQKPLTRKERLEVEKRRANYVALVIIGIIVVAVGAGVATFAPGLIGSGGNNSGGTATSSAFDPVNTCVPGQVNLVMHIHTRLYIVINGFQEVIPANTGISGTCTHAIHTHDTSGELHVESHVEYNFKLTHFFQIWGQTFNRNNILGHVADSDHVINFTVNGQVSQEYENLVLRDGQRIVIEYTSKAPPSPLLKPPDTIQASGHSTLFKLEAFAEGKPTSAGPVLQLARLQFLDRVWLPS